MIHLMLDETELETLKGIYQDAVEARDRFTDFGDYSPEDIANEAHTVEQDKLAERLGLTPGAAVPFPQSIKVARMVAEWHIGDPNWAEVILFAYMNPMAALDALEEAMKS